MLNILVSQDGTRLLRTSHNRLFHFDIAPDRHKGEAFDDVRRDNPPISSVLRTISEGPDKLERGLIRFEAIQKSRPAARITLQGLGQIACCQVFCQGIGINANLLTVRRGCFQYLALQ